MWQDGMGGAMDGLRAWDLYSRWPKQCVPKGNPKAQRTHPCLAAHPDQNSIEMTISERSLARWPRSEVTSPDTGHPDVATGLISAGSETQARELGRIRDLSRIPDRLWSGGKDRWIALDLCNVGIWTLDSSGYDYTRLTSGHDEWTCHLRCSLLATIHGLLWS
ncbi:hypothetical protein BJY01DRAFT_128347 [Aspergillus pseudoustus]|uniref:Uncharacterized protein n=1 Tax=Aspergillus pseudoustus TaxID=1810923 RepID=A0ABR4KEI3_9EURO